jgi:light-regulated signal transduction histidine kinase (bacteriophytochrome)
MTNDNLESLGDIILLVDDNLDNIELLKIILEEDGYEIVFASNGEQALEMTSKLNPKLILLDIMMPGIDGFETCQKLKENKTTREIPVIFLSAKNMPEDIVKGFEVGGLDYITKPFNIYEVRRRVKTHLQTQNLIAQKEKSEEKAKAYSQELEIRNQELKDFINIASHDLREPLRKISIFGSLLEEATGQLGQKEKSYIGKIKNSASRMESFLDDILELSLVTVQANPFRKVDLKKIIKQVTNDLEASILETNGIVECGELPSIEGDKFQIRQLFQNLVSNSLKFHRKEAPPHIKIASSHDTNGTWNITIEDNGIGFDQKFSSRIFKPFERLHSHSQFKGTGMGLAICQKIAIRHGGKITVQSQVGKGSTFTIALPKTMNPHSPS